MIENYPQLSVLASEYSSQQKKSLTEPSIAAELRTYLWQGYGVTPYSQL
jgi:hypothetical protein